MATGAEKKVAKSDGGHAFHKVRNVSPGIVAGDLAAALATGTLAGLNASIVDRAIMMKSLGRSTSIWTEFKHGYKTVLLAPHRFFLPTDPPNNFSIVYRLAFTVYFGTYIAGNVTQSWCEAHDIGPGFPKFINGSIANVVLTLYKDNEMMKLLGKPGLPVPTFSRMLCVLRDSLTVLAAFWLTDYVAGMVRRQFPNLTKKQASDAADVVTPACVQFISTPIHLLAIVYKEHVSIRNDPAALWKVIKPQYGPAVIARIGRIIPAFGIGMMINRRVRDKAGRYVEGEGDD